MLSVDDINRLEKENEWLKTQYNCYACDTCNGKEDYRNMKKHCENAIKTVHNYRKALNKIQKILDKSCKQCKYEFFNEDYCSEGDCFEIRRIIEEVLDA